MSHIVEQGKALTVAAHELAEQIRDRLEAQEVKGKRRDRDALELWLGAVMLARITGQNDLAAYLERLACFLLATRGYSWIVEFIGDAKRAPADATPRERLSFHVNKAIERGEEPITEQRS